MKLHRELGIGRKAAWFMLHRLRKAVETGLGGKRLRYRDLTNPDGLPPSGVRG